jgi:hypothetical protein
MLLLLILYFIYTLTNCQIRAQNKQCSNCKFFIPHKNNKVNSNEKIIYNFAQHCRDDENLCGKNSTFYEEGGIINLESNKNDTNDANDANDANDSNDANDANDTKDKNSENIISMLDDEMKQIINDYHLFLKNNNDW